MMKIEMMEEKREGKEIIDQFDMAAYAKATFGMYQGNKEKVQIQFPKRMMQEKVFRVPSLRFIKIRIALPAIWFWNWDRQFLTEKQNQLHSMLCRMYIT